MLDCRPCGLTTNTNYNRKVQFPLYMLLFSSYLPSVTRSHPLRSYFPAPFPLSKPTRDRIGILAKKRTQQGDNWSQSHANFLIVSSHLFFAIRPDLRQLSLLSALQQLSSALWHEPPVISSSFVILHPPSGKELKGSTRPNGHKSVLSKLSDDSSNYGTRGILRTLSLSSAILCLISSKQWWRGKLEWEWERHRPGKKNHPVRREKCCDISWWGPLKGQLYPLWWGASTSLQWYFMSLDLKKNLENFTI